jgi:hypothetical protein
VYERRLGHLNILACLAGSSPRLERLCNTPRKYLIGQRQPACRVYEIEVESGRPADLHAAFVGLTAQEIAVRFGRSQTAVWFEAAFAQSIAKLNIGVFIMRLALIVLVSALCATAHAQTIYRSVMPDGKIVFGDKPAPGAKESKPVAQRPPNISVPGPTSGSDAPSRQQTLETATNEVNAAQQNVDRARAALEAGREPTPAERIGTKTGMRTTEAYDQRIKALELDLSTAQKQLDDAQGKRNNAR